MKIFSEISKNENYIKSAMYIPLSADAIFRSFAVMHEGEKHKAFLIYYEGLVSNERIDQFILQSLHLIPQKSGDRLEDTVADRLLSINQLTIETEFEKVLDKVNYGGCAVFIDTIDKAYVLDVKGWQMRGISEPATEAVIRGSQEAFIETMRINTSLVRRLVRQEKLICESFTIGSKSKTPCSLMYIKDKAESEIVAEIQRRIKAIDTEYITDSGELEQLLEDFSFFPSPQILSTERPDRAASALMEGKAVVILDGTPFVLIMPINAFDLVHTPEDKALRVPYGNLVRIIRIIALVFSLLLPALFIAVCNFHQETIPVHLLFAISASRRAVPFSLITELILFEIAFEIIREASIRIPSTAGSAIGIIGGLIIGQAAIDANIVSPIVIIIVALTGIGSFTIPNYSLTFSYRILKYVYILLAATAGMLGLTFGIAVHICLLCNSQSLGVPFLAPFSDSTEKRGGRLLVDPVWKRYSYKNPRKWAKGFNSTKTPVKTTKIE